MARTRNIKPSDSPVQFVDGDDWPKRPGDTILYRFYDEDSNLLYVGITRRLRDRLTTHRRCAKWWDRAAILVTEFWPNRYEALKAELRAIHNEWPSYNIAGVRRCG